MRGLTSEEARRRHLKFGPNEIPSYQSHGFLRLVIEILKEPMTILLAACGILYAFIGERQDAFVLLGFWGLIVFITLYQEGKTEHALESLRDLSSPRAIVIRAGSVERVPARELVVGDLVQLRAGDIVPADVVLREPFQIQVDESLLTGESFSVRKDVNDPAWAGTIVVQGQALAEVTSIGTETKLGQIGKVLKSARRAETPLKKETQRVVKILTVFSVLLSILTGVVYVLFHEDLASGVLVGLTLAMAILPNEIPAVLTIFLSLGTRRLSQKHVLTRKISAVDSIGAVSVLCVDKTGTLTMNKMTVQRKVTSFYAQVSELDLLRTASLASNLKTFDPMERAIEEAYQGQEKPLQLVLQYQWSPELFAMSNLWRSVDSKMLMIATKGAPEAVLKMCRLPSALEIEVNAKVDELAAQGLRVLAIAQGACNENELPANQIDLPLEFLGLLGFSDPVRPGVADAVKECHEAGIRVIMMTGDHAKTAATVAEEIGLRQSQKILSGSDLEKMTDTELKEQLNESNCFSRMLPEQKLRIVKALQERGEVVAMTGDGVNDAPALAAAQVGIAMGQKGTDVAREAASIVLLDDDFTTIVKGIRIGRRIYDNLQAAIGYLTAVHIPIAGISVLPVLLNLPIILMPVHVAFLHLLIEPTCSLVFEAEPGSTNIMRRNPRREDQPIFSGKAMAPAVVQGLIIFSIIFFVFLYSLKRGRGELDSRALGFTVLFFSNLALVFMNRSWMREMDWKGFSRNRFLWPVVISSLVVLLLVLYVPFFRGLFHFSFLHAQDLLLSLFASIVGVFCFEFWKRFSFKKKM
nr:cation-translocating P-type ATPase [Bdellovibrio bacteriovorus]